MKNLLAFGVLSLAAIAVCTAPASAWCFHCKDKDDCNDGKCCHHHKAPCPPKPCYPFNAFCPGLPCNAPGQFAICNGNVFLVSTGLPCMNPAYGWNQTANYQPNGYGPNVFISTGNGQNGYGPNGYAPNGYAPNGYGQNGYGPNGYAPNGYGPNGYGPNGYGPNGYGPNGYGPNGFIPTGYGPNPYGFNGIGAPGYGPNPYGFNGIGILAMAPMAMALTAITPTAAARRGACRWAAAILAAIPPAVAPASCLPRPPWVDTQATSKGPCPRPLRPWVAEYGWSVTPRCCRRAWANSRLNDAQRTRGKRPAGFRVPCLA